MFKFMSYHIVYFLNGLPKYLNIQNCLYIYMSMDRLHDIPRKVSTITLRVSISRNRCSSVYFYMAKILPILSKLPKTMNKKNKQNISRERSLII